MATLFLGLVLFGAVLNFTGFVMYLLAGFKENVLWGIGMILVFPLVALAFTFIHWDVAKKAGLLYAGGLVITVVFAVLALMSDPEFKNRMEISKGTAETSAVVQ